jgi:hypothetical protein
MTAVRKRPFQSALHCHSKWIAARRLYARTCPRLISTTILLAITSPILSHAAFQFVEVSGEAGIDSFTMAHGHGGGMVASDFDKDGDIDLFVPNGEGVADQLYVNLGSGVFENRAADLGVASLNAHRVALWFDYNGDHRMDLVTVGDCFNIPEEEECQGSLALYRQTAQGDFEDVSGQAGELDFTDRGHLGGLAAGDIDGDGFLDLFISSWGLENRFFRNNGDGSFADITESFEDDQLYAPVWQPFFYDFTGDGRQDLYLAVDFWSDRLLVNEGGGAFFDVATEVGTDGAVGEMGIAPGDFDNDGDIDLFISNTHPDNRFYRNDSSFGSLMFTDIAEIRDMDDTSWSWGCTFFDADNDGYLDLAVTNGFRTPGELARDESVFFLSLGGDPVTFDRLSDDVGFNDDLYGSSLLAIDFNRDGLQDLAQTTVEVGGNPSQVRLLKNTQDDASANRFIIVRPRQDGPNHWAIGALIRVAIGDTTMTRLITAGTSFLGQEPAEAHFGLADATIVDALTVEWPDGFITTYEDIAINQLITVTREGYTGQALHDGPPTDPTNQGPTSVPPGMPTVGFAGLALLLILVTFGGSWAIVFRRKGQIQN